jgi:hypothetical protein
MRTAPATSTATPVTQVRLVPYLLITYTQLDPTMLAARAVCSCPQFSVYKEITLKAPVQSNHTITTMKGRLQKDRKGEMRERGIALAMEAPDLQVQGELGQPFGALFL